MKPMKNPKNALSLDMKFYKSKLRLKPKDLYDIIFNNIMTINALMATKDPDVFAINAVCKDLTFSIMAVREKHIKVSGMKELQTAHKVMNKVDQTNKERAKRLKSVNPDAFNSVR